MSDNFPKITFNDKADSWELNSDSKYIITADNINEIKRVVNELSDSLSDALVFADVYSYLRIEVPRDLDEESLYDIEIDISTSKEFTDNSSIKLSQNASLFYIFDNDKWMPLNLSSISKSKEGRILAVKIFDLIKNRGLTYFGRYKFVNLTHTNEITRYIGFCLGSYNTGDSKNKVFKEIFLKAPIGNANFDLYEGESEEYRVIGRTWANDDIDITDYAVFSSNNYQLNVSDNVVTVNSINEQGTCILNYTARYKDVIYENKQEIFVHPLKFVKIMSNIPKVIDKNTPVSSLYSVSGLTSYGKVKQIPTNNIKFTFLNNSFMSANNGLFKVDKSKISENETVKYLISYNEDDSNILANLVDVQEIKVNLPLNDTLIFDLNPRTNDQYILNSKEYFSNIDYEFKVYANSRSNEVTNNVEITNKLNVKDVYVNGNIISCDSEDIIPAIFEIKYNEYGNQIIRNKYVIFRPIKLNDLKITYIETSTNTEETFNCKFGVEYENGIREDINGSNDVKIDLVAGNPDLVKRINKSIITCYRPNKLNENLCFRATYKNFEKLFIITLHGIID